MALFLLVCGCLCVAGLLVDTNGSDPAVEGPYVNPDDDWTAPTAGPTTPE
ncbi:hypothetical protein [Micromonospora sp. NPDC005203]